MLQYKDFVPKQISAPGFIKPGEHENFDDAVAAANAWLSENRVNVISFETVVLPNIWSQWEEGSGDASLGIGGSSPSHWHQFLRCWYHESDSNPDNANSADAS